MQKYLSKSRILRKLCSCIKKVRDTVKLRIKSRNKESAAIAICVKSVLQRRGKTLKRFSCRKKELYMQKYTK
jgi:hypothetical protein